MMVRRFLKKACLLGYHGMQNAGDDAFFTIVVDWLENQVGVSSVEVFGEKNFFPTVEGDIQISGVPKAGKGGIGIRLTELLLYCRNQLVVHAAGSLFQRRDFFWLFMSTLIAKIWGWLTFRPRKIVAFGVSLGPFHSRWDRFWCNRAMRLFDLVVLRDKSDELFLHRIPTPPIVHGNDLALVLKGPKGIIKSELGSPKRKKIGFTIVDRDRSHNRPEVDDRKREVLVTVLQQLHANEEVKGVTGIVFCNHPIYGDVDPTEEVLNSLSDHGIPVEKCNYSSDPQNNFEAISNFDLMVGNRMHSFIFALICRVPTVAIAYEPKILEFAKNCGLPAEIVIPLNELSTDRLHAAMAYALSQESRDKVDAAMKRAQKAQQELLLDVARTVGS